MCYVSSSVQSSPYIAHFGVMETQLVWVNYMKHLARPNCGKSKLLTGAEYVENYSKKDPDGKPTEVKWTMRLAVSQTAIRPLRFSASSPLSRYKLVLDEHKRLEENSKNTAQLFPSSLWFHFLCVSGMKGCVHVCVRVWGQTGRIPLMWMQCAACFQLYFLFLASFIAACEKNK